MAGVDRMRKGAAREGCPFDVVETRTDLATFRSELRDSVAVTLTGGGWVPEAFDGFDLSLSLHLERLCSRRLGHEKVQAVSTVVAICDAAERQAREHSEKQRAKRLGVKAEPSSYQVEALRWFDIQHAVWKKSGGNLPKPSAMDVHNHLADWAARLPDDELKALTGDLPHEDTVGRWLRKRRTGT